MGKAGKWETTPYRVIAVNEDGTLNVRSGLPPLSIDGDDPTDAEDGVEYGYTLKDKKYPDEVKELTEKQKAYIAAHTSGGKFMGALPDTGGAKTDLLISACC